ncbi:hypothetical protein SAMN04488103_109163 [Gemmobacter aquatilis]|uniref:Uncharacterized protein n=1 Tax=Gemmobacter aquatilis TaxID=933059 RepID=A0A1H8KPM5_9RHOB|nr:hypothetical protein [Gemmobacter aquatilis]SEN94872.1 hypothetical protein SAMN04488103_109163 [Gemmobacter aquatilis]
MTQSHPIITLSRLIRTARVHTPGGVLFADDLTGLYRRTASLHGLTPDAVQQLHRSAESAGAHIPGARAA